MSDLLRDYQRKAVDSAREMLYHQGLDSCLIVAPTGAGKTHIISDICKRSDDADMRAWVLVHRDHLITQVSDRLKAFGVDHGVIAPNRAQEYHKRIQVASVFTLPHRLPNMLLSELPDQTLFDEAHHLAAATWQKIRVNTKTSKHLGFTATPERMDGKGLKTTYNILGESNHDGFEGMISVTSTPELMDRGVLVRPTIYFPPTNLSMKGARRKPSGDFSDKDNVAAVRKAHLMGDVVKHYLNTCPGVPGVVFSASVQLAKDQAEEFNNAGVPAAALYGELSVYQKRSILEQLENGDILIVTSCDLIGEGWDLPKCGYVGLARPTGSLGLLIQMVGRGLRAADGKTTAYIFDHADNIRRVGNPLLAYNWTLDGIDSHQRADAVEAAKALKRCSECFMMNYATRVTCTGCGAELPDNSRQVETHSGQLILFDEASVHAAQVAKAAKKADLSRRLGQAAQAGCKYESFKRIADEEKQTQQWAYQMWKIALKRMNQRAN